MEEVNFRNIYPDYVSLELAKRLKELGVEFESNMYWSSSGHLSPRPSDLPAPTLWDTRRWLKKKYNVDVVSNRVGKAFYTYNIFLASWPNSPDDLIHGEVAVNSYEDSINLGLFVAITTLWNKIHS